MPISRRLLLLVFWLALLQGASPLLHAHVLGQVVPRGVHMHGLEVASAGPVPYWHPAAAPDGTEVGMAQAAPQSPRVLPPDLLQAVLPRSADVGLRRAWASFVPGGLGAQPPPPDACPLTPPSQAPPLRLA